MAHKSLVGGTAYNISGGKSMVSGTSYNISGGKTLVGGTGYSISFALDNNDDAYAMLYNSNGSSMMLRDLFFQRNDKVESGLTLYNIYTDFENSEYASASEVPWYDVQLNLYQVIFKDEISPYSMQYWFNNSYYMINCDTSKLNMNKVINMVNTYYNCTNLRGSPICGDNVVNMYSTYSRCYKLTGHPICGNNVTNMCATYYYCSSLTGNPVCGENVTNMVLTYVNCRRLTGNPVCGNNVTNMRSTYANCSNLTGNPVCGDKVTEMSATYYDCGNLTGNPVCGESVINMNTAYAYCYNLTGSPVCGNNVVNMLGTYSAWNCTGNAYFYSAKINNSKNCFVNKNNSKRLNIYIPNNSTTKRTVLYNNTRSLVGANITWTNAGTYQYNTSYNIYIYPVANVAAAAIANGDEEANANAGITINSSHSGGWS